MEAAAEQQVLAARHKAAQQETAAEAKQLRAEVRKLTQQLTNSRHSSRYGQAAWEKRVWGSGLKGRGRRSAVVSAG